MLGFDHSAASAAQLLDALIDGVGDQADEAAGDEDAGERDHQTDNSSGPAGVGGEASTIDDTQQRLPERLSDPQPLSAVDASHAEHREDRGGEHDDGNGQDAQPTDDYGRALGQRDVEAVAQASERVGSAVRSLDGVGKTARPPAAVHRSSLPAWNFNGRGGRFVAGVHDHCVSGAWVELPSVSPEANGPTRIRRPKCS